MRVEQRTGLGNPGVWAAALLTLGCLNATGAGPATAAGESSDLSGRVVAQITRQSYDNFSSEIQYEVRAVNLTDQTFEADSLQIVLYALTNFAGQPVDPVSQQSLISQVEILGNDGTTADGKPYFHAPLPGQDEFGPYAKSEAVTVRLRNTSYITGLTPSFKVFGQKKKEPPPEEPRPPAEEPRPPGAGPAPRRAAPPPERKLEKKFDALIDVLLKKGVLTEEERREVVSPRLAPAP